MVRGAGRMAISRPPDAGIRGGTSFQLAEWHELMRHPLLREAAETAEWAERHIKALKVNLDAFGTDPLSKATLRADLDIQTGYHVFSVSHGPDLAGSAVELRHAVADAAGDLHAALGQFAWSLACDYAPSGTPADERAIFFPICDPATPQWFVTGSLPQRARPFFDPQHWAFIESVQPYHNSYGHADGWLGAYIHPLILLQEIANRHKHRFTEPVMIYPSSVTLEVGQFHDTDDMFQLSDWLAGVEVKLNEPVLRLRLTSDAPAHIEHAGEFVPAVAIAERRPVTHALERAARFVQFILSKFGRQFPP